MISFFCKRALVSVISVIGVISASGQSEELPGCSLPGVVSTAAWNELHKEVLKEAMIDASPWAVALPAQTGEAKLVLQKVSGSAYAVNTGLYSGDADYTGPLVGKIISGKVMPVDLAELKAGDFVNPGRFRVSTTSPLQPLETVIFFIRIQGLPPGSHFTAFELILHPFPATLSYNGGNQQLRAVARKRWCQKLKNGFHEEIYALQWDLRKLKEPVKEYSLEWTVYPHSCTTGIKVQEGSLFSDLSSQSE